MADNRPITFNTLKELLPFVVILVSLVLAWGSITAQQAVTDSKIDTIIMHETHLDDQIGIIETAQNDQGKDIAVMKEILQHNNLSDAGLPPANNLALAPFTDPSNTSATLEPTPVPTSIPPTINNSTTFIVAPTQQPTPSPTTPPLLCVSLLCI